MYAFLGALGSAVFIIGLIVAIVMRFLKKATWKRVLVASLVGLVAMFYGFSKDLSTPVVETPAPATQAELASIQIKIDAQDEYNTKDKQKVVVRMENTSTEHFDGTLSVTSNDVDGRSLGRDTVVIQDLNPGKTTFAILWLETSPFAPSFETNISGTFQ